MSFSKRIDRSLISRAQKGDSAALVSIYEEFKSPIYSLAYNITRNKAASEDILQLVIEKVILKISDLNNYKAFNGWLKTISYREAIDYINKSKKETFLDQERDDNLYEELIVTLNEPTFDMNVYLETLKDRERTVVLLYLIEGYTHKQIASKMKITLNNSKQIYSRALSKLRELSKKEAYSGSNVIRLDSR